MTMVIYPAIVEGDSISGYSVFFPDLPGCVSAADDLNELLAGAQEALSLHLQGMLEDGEPLPTATPLENLDRPETAVGATPVLVELDAPVARINISMDIHLLKRVDTAADREGRTRSGYLAEAARRMLARN